MVTNGGKESQANKSVIVYKRNELSFSGCTGSFREQNLGVKQQLILIRNKIKITYMKLFLSFMVIQFVLISDISILMEACVCVHKMITLKQGSFLVFGVGITTNKTSRY